MTASRAASVISLDALMNLADGNHVHTHAGNVTLKSCDLELRGGMQMTMSRMPSVRRATSSNSEQTKSRCQFHDRCAESMCGHAIRKNSE